MMQGILIVDKPTDWTSFDVIAKLRGILGTRKLGHSGTLDPMATGVLPVFCGGASKAVDLQLDHTKASENEYTLTVKCSKGTYIRVLLEEIAEAMGQKGTMSALRRVAAGAYSEADAHTLEEIQAAKDAGPEALQALMLPVESVFASLPLLVADERVEQHLYNGCPTSRYPAADGRYRVRNAGGQFLGLANVVNGVLKVEKLFVERN